MVGARRIRCAAFWRSAVQELTPRRGVRCNSGSPRIIMLPAIVGDDEEVASFVFESNKFKKDELDYRQLMQSRKYGNTSVYLIEGLTETETSDAGHAIALVRSKPGILGWAILIAKAIRLLQPHPLK